MKQSFVLASMFTATALLAACHPASTHPSAATESAASVTVTDGQIAQKTASVTVASGVSDQAAQTGTPKQINWALIDSGVKAVDKARFHYPFALDSEPVKAYAEMYHVDNQTSRYNLTVGMAVNEILSKVLDQIGSSYVSHELTPGKDSAFVIHTTKQIAPSEYTYVFAEPFAKGLTIPVKIINDGKK